MFDSHEQRVYLGLQSLGVSGEERCPPNVVQLQEQHQHTLETDTASAMRRASELERVQVVAHRRGVDALAAHALFQQLRVVDTLGPREDFLASHKEIIRVGEGLSMAFVLAAANINY